MSSIIKVDTIQDQAGNNIISENSDAITIGASGDTVTIPSGATLTTTNATVNLPATLSVTTELKTNKISPASGTAFTLGDSGDTFTIPSGATITNSGTATGFGGGKINQVLNTGSTSSYSSSSDVEVLSLAITPTATSSKILILCGIGFQLNTDEYASADIYRGSLASGTKIMDGGETVFSAQNNIRFGFHFSHLDSPSTTSETTYTLVGVPLFSDTLTFGAGGRTTMTLMEVLA